MTCENIARWLKFALCALIMALWINCLCLLCLASWIRDNLTPIVIIAGETPVGRFYLNSFFPLVFPVLIASSCIALVIGCVGCCGICTNNNVVLGWFFFSILLSFCVEISAGVWGKLDWNLYYHKDDVQLLYKTAVKFEQNSQSWFVRTWSEIHEKFHCCGIYSSDDWADLPHILSTCNIQNQGSITNGRSGCGEDLLRFLTKPGPVKAMPYIATMIGTIQVMCLIITAKLWMITCAKRGSMSNQSTPAESTLLTQTPSAASSQYDGIRKGPTTPSSGQYHLKVVSNSGENKPTKCRHCQIEAYERMKFLSLSKLEAEYQQVCESTGRFPSRPTQMPNQNRKKILKHYRTRHTSPSGCACPSPCAYSSFASLRMKKSASYNLPTTWRSYSTTTMNGPMREYHTVSLPRKKYPYRNPRWRNRIPGSYVNRLSTIRASGVPVESDSSTNVSLNMEELGGSKCYNTEVGSSSSEQESCCPDEINFECQRNISENTERRIINGRETKVTSLHQAAYTTL